MAACSMRKRAMNNRTTTSHPTSVTAGPLGNGGRACDSRTSNMPSQIGTGFVTGLPGNRLSSRSPTARSPAYPGCSFDPLDWTGSNMGAPLPGPARAVAYVHPGGMPNRVPRANHRHGNNPEMRLGRAGKLYMPTVEKTGPTRMHRPMSVRILRFDDASLPLRVPACWIAWHSGVQCRMHGQGSCAFRWGPGATQAPWSSFGGKESMTHRSLRFSTVPDSCKGTESSGNQQPLYGLPLPTLTDWDLSVLQCCSSDGLGRVACSI